MKLVFDSYFISFWQFYAKLFNSSLIFFGVEIKIVGLM